jgi:hypothetical protein
MHIKTITSLQDRRNEVEAFVEEDMLEFDDDETTPKISLATITCTRQTWKKEELLPKKEARYKGRHESIDN